MINSENQQKESDESVFDTFDIDSNLKKPGNSGVYEINKSIFSFIPNLQEEKSDQNEDKNYPKYFAKISNKLFGYTGVLSNQLKRDSYGYSLCDNKDEYLGEYKEELKDGFGIYKFKESDRESEIYIGDYKENIKTGQGIYLSITKKIQKEKILLINYDCGIGTFENDSFKEGKIFSINNEVENLYCGKIDELGSLSDENGLIIEQGDKFFKGKVKEGKMMEGRIIFVDKDGQKSKAYYFSKKDDSSDDINFDYSKNEEKDEDTIKEAKKKDFKIYKKEIQNIFDKMNEMINNFKDFEKARKIDFEEDVKNYIVEKITKLIEN